MLLNPLFFWWRVGGGAHVEEHGHHRCQKDLASAQHPVGGSPKEEVHRKKVSVLTLPLYSPWLTDFRNISHALERFVCSEDMGYGVLTIAVAETRVTSVYNLVA